VDILEKAEASNEEAISYHFNDISECNKAEEPVIKSVRKLEASELAGLQHIQ